MEKKKKNGRQKKKKKKHSTELQKPNVEAEVYNGNKKCDWIYTYTYTPISENQNCEKIKYNRLTHWTKETTNFIYQKKTK